MNATCECGGKTNFFIGKCVNCGKQAEVCVNCDYCMGLSEEDYDNNLMTCTATGEKFNADLMWDSRLDCCPGFKAYPWF